jgi:hypothetical protein
MIKWLVRFLILLLLAGAGALVYFREPILDGMKRLTSTADREARRVEKARRRAEKTAGAVEKTVERGRDAVSE